ncbi:MAG: GntR family transcriptional regulator [Anaerolineales bacterium]
MSFPDHLLFIDRQSKQPLYDQIEQNLCELIIKGHLAAGQALPSENDLAELYGVNRLTVRRALDEMVRHRWVARRRGIGTFVSQPHVASISPVKLSFTDEMRSIGRRAGSQLIEQKVIPANLKIAQHLNLHEGEDVFELTRVRLADDIPLLLETSCLPHERFPDLENEPSLAHGSLYAHLLEVYRVQVTGMDQTLKPVLLTRAQAQLLDAEPGVPGIVSEIVAYDRAGEPVEYSWSVTSGDKCEFYFRFRHGTLT